jgi:nitric oxide reductase subunit B
MMRLGSGSVVALGVVLFLISVFGPAREQIPNYVPDSEKDKQKKE